MDPIRKFAKTDVSRKHPWKKDLGIFFETCSPEEAKLLIRTLHFNFPNGSNTGKVGYALLRNNKVVEVKGHYSLMPQVGETPTPRGLFLKPIPKEEYESRLRAADDWMAKHHPEIKPLRKERMKSWEEKYLPEDWRQKRIEKEYILLTGKKLP